MLVRVKAVRGLLVALACLLPLGFAAAASASSDCPECDQYELVIPDPRGGGGSDGRDPRGGGGSDGRSAPPTSSGAGESSQTNSGSSAGDQDGAISAPSEAAREASAERRERREQRRRERRRTRSATAEIDDALAGDPVASRTTLPAEQPLDYSDPSTASAALAQFANPLTLVVMAAMGGSLWFARRRGES